VRLVVAMDMRNTYILTNNHVTLSLAHRGPLFHPFCYRHLLHDGESLVLQNPQHIVILMVRHVTSFVKVVISVRTLSDGAQSEADTKYMFYLHPLLLKAKVILALLLNLVVNQFRNLFQL
jgi:hypothetical protein